MECNSGAREHCKLSLRLAAVILRLKNKVSTEQNDTRRSDLQTLLDNATTQQNQLDRQWSRVLQKHRSNFGSPCECPLDSVDQTWFPL